MSNRSALVVALVLMAVLAGPRSAHAQPPRTDSDGGMMMARPVEARWPRTDPWQPDGWPQLPAQVKANLSNDPLLPFPVSTPNVRANDPSGDQANDAQSFVSVAAWGRFVVAVWTDTKGAEGSPGFPPTTEVGFATSCDWGATFTDGGSVPRIASNDQAFHPTLSTDGRGNFYMAATYLSRLDAAGVPTSTAIGFWRGGFDTTACTFAWNTPQALQQTPLVVGGNQIDRVRVVADPFDDYVHLLHVIRAATGKDQVAALSSADGGAIWGAARTVASGLGSGAWFVGVPDATVGPNHELYVVWSDRMVWVTCEFQSPQFVTPDGSQVYFNKSLDHGATWGVESAISTLYSTYLSGGPTDLTGQIKVNPRIAVDRTTGANRGNVYVTWPASGSWVAEPGSDSTTVELEPNGVPNGARPLQLGESGTGISTNSADVDYWRINLVAGQTLLARLEPQDWACGSFSTSFGFLLQLLTSPANGAVDVSDSLLQSSNFSGFVSQVVFTCRRSGTYYLRVQQNTLGANVNYTLRTRSVLFGQQAGSGRDEGDILLSRSTSGGTSWGPPIIVNTDAPLGFQETGPSVTVDASGRVLVGWHDHRDSETDPVSVGEAQLTDSYLAESTNGGTSFGPGQRVSSARSLIGQNQREVFYSTGLHTDLVTDGNHLLMGWDDQRLATRATNSVDAYVQFADREVPGIAFFASPVDSFRAGTQPVTYQWLGSDRGTPQGGMRYEGTLVNLTSGTSVLASIPDTTTTLTFAHAGLPGDGWYELSVRARDVAGNVSPAFARKRFLVDGTPPTVAFTSSVPNGGITTIPSATISWVGADNFTPTQQLRYSYSFDGAPASPFDTVRVFVASALTPGAHRLLVTARDLEGNLTAPPAEFAFRHDPPMSGDFTVGGTSPSYATIAAAIADLTARGVSGPVTIAVRPGTYAGPVMLTAVAGASASNRVTLRSESGIASDVVLQAATTADADGVVKLQGASWVTVRDLTLEVTSANGTGAGVLVSGAPMSTEVLGCVITGLQSNGRGVFVNTGSVDSLRVAGNAISAGQNGVLFVNSTLNAVRVERNTIHDAAQYGIYALGCSGTGLQVANNFLVNAGIQLLSTSAPVDVFHNSVNMTNAAEAFTVNTNAPATPPDRYRVRNNVFACPGGGRAMSVTYAPAVSLADHNDLWTSGGELAYWDAHLADLAALQAASGKHAQSLSLNPGFVSATDLHTGLAALDGAGVPLASVTDDFDGQARDPVAPDLGADEFGTVTSITSPVPVSVWARDSVEFTWNHEPAAANAFRLDIATAPTADSMITSMHLGNVTRAAFRGPLLDGVRYYARIAPSTDGGGTYLVNSPFSVAVTADLVAPQAVLVGGPPQAGHTNADPVQFTFTGVDNLAPISSLRFRWRVDAAGYTAPDPGTTAVLSPLPEGAHVFELVAVDPAGNVSVSPVVRNFTVDRTPPETQIAGGPAPGAIVSSNVLTYNWTGTDDRTPLSNLRFQYQLDAGGFVNVGQALTGAISNVPDGAHTFGVRALDLAENLDATPATRAVTVDAQGPVVTVLAGPGPALCIATDTTSFRWTAADVVSPRAALQFAYGLDGGPLTAFGPDTTAQLSGLVDGTHTIVIQSLDERGHVGSVARSFTIDTQLPIPFLPTARALDVDRVLFICTGTDNTGITGFHLQVAADTTFASVLAEVDLPGQGEYTFTGLPGNTYYGRARARDCAGNTSVYSSPSNAASLANLANLVPIHVEVPPTATAGQLMNVRWTVGNDGLGTANVAQWFDDLYLSPTRTFDGNNVRRFGPFQNLTALDPGDTYTLTRDLLLPVDIQGQWWVFVKTDATGAVPETNAADNLVALDSVVVSLGAVANLEVTQVTAPLTALTEHPVTVVWRVKNTGTGRTPVDHWYDTLFLSDDNQFDFLLVGDNNRQVLDTPLASVEHFGALLPDSSYTVTATVTMPVLPGGSQTKWFAVASDLRASSINELVSERGDVFENLNELNVRVADSTDVSVAQPADLVVDAVRALNSTGALSGGTIPVTWTVRNAGFSGTSTSSWVDRLWLSADGAFDAGDVLLGDFPHGGTLDLDDHYDIAPSVRLPEGLSGRRFLIVTADGFGQVREFSDANNSRASVTPIDIALAPWPNLRPIAGIAPDTVVAGRTAQLRWQVANLSPNGRSLSGTWRDDLYLSSSPTWNPGGARRLAEVSQTHSLLPGQSYTGSATVTIPTDFAGDFFVYVFTDATAQVYEHTDEGDNLQLVIGGAVTGGGGTPPLVVRPYPPVDVTVSEVTAAPLAVSTSDPLTIDWRLRNTGEAATLASNWPEQVWLSADTTWSPGTDIRLADLQHGGTLLAGGTSTGHTTVFVPNGISGTYHVLVVSDPGGSTSDVALANNVSASPDPIAFTAIAAPPAPNLVLTGLTAPASGRSGQPFSVSVGVRNLGPGVVAGRSYSVSAYLSLDARLDGTDIVLGAVPGPSELTAGATSNVALGLTLPNHVSGPYFLLLLADSRGEVAEGSDSDNAALQPLQAILPPPSDLVVRDVVVGSPTVTPGQPMTVTYTLENVGANPAEGFLDNAVYLSADTTFDSIVDPLVGLEQRSISLLPGQAVVLKQAVLFRALPLAGLPAGVTSVTPPLTPGPYHAIVRANVRQSIRESNGDNNARSSAATVDGQIPTLAIGVPQSFDLSPGQSAFFQVTVPDGQDLTLTSQSDVPGATNEMFVAFGHTPTGSEFEFSGPAGFTATPSVLVPGTRAGSYFLMFTSRSLGTLATSEHVTLSASLLPFSLTAHSPAVGGEGGMVTGRVSGAGLRDTTVFQLFSNTGFPVTTGRIARLVNSTEALVRWDLRGIARGLYTVHARNGTESVALADVFTVEAAREPAVAIETDQADLLRRNAIAPFTFTFRNTSNVDIEVLRARVMYPARSVLRTLVQDPGLLTRSARSPQLFAPLAGDVFVAHDPRTGDSLAVIDVLGGHLAPGEARRLTVAVSGLETSPYSMLAMAGVSSTRDFLDREAAYAERARRQLLAKPAGVSLELLALAGSAEGFRLEALRALERQPGLLDGDAVELYLTGAPSGLPLPVADLASEGPAGLLAEALTAECLTPQGVPECVLDAAPVACAMPGCRVVFDTDVPVALAFGGGAVPLVSGSTARGYSEFVCADAKVVAPCDPNVLTGPAGFGAERWWSNQQVMNYKVDFENLSGIGAAPAQVARVTVPIPADYDVATFRLLNAGFGGNNGKIVTVPAGRTSYDNGGIFYSDLGLYVQFTAGIDPTSRLATFTFSTLDANRQPPNNALTGFLPVNDATGRGQGFVQFSIKPRHDIPSGTTVALGAAIRFDQNALVPTNSFSNRIDSQRPLSGITPVFDSLDASHIRISWSGQDDPGGSDLKGFTVFARRDSLPYTNVGTLLTSNAMDLVVEDGHSYSFYSRATDNTDNTETDKAVPDQILTIGRIRLGTGDPLLPRITMLHQNAPNPWRGNTLIRFDLATSSEVTLEVFDIQGRVVAKLLDHKRLQPGRHAIPIDHLRGGPGVYFYRMNARSFSGTRRMVRLQ